MAEHFPARIGDFPNDTSYTIRGKQLTVQIRRRFRSEDEWLLNVFGLPVSRALRWIAPTIVGGDGVIPVIRPVEKARAQ